MFELPLAVSSVLLRRWCLGEKLLVTTEHHSDSMVFPTRLLVMFKEPAVYATSCKKKVAEEPTVYLIISIYTCTVYKTVTAHVLTFSCVKSESWNEENPDWKRWRKSNQTCRLLCFNMYSGLKAVNVKCQLVCIPAQFVYLFLRTRMTQIHKYVTRTSSAKHHLKWQQRGCDLTWVCVTSLGWHVNSCIVLRMLAFQSSNGYVTFVYKYKWGQQLPFAPPKSLK